MMSVLGSNADPSTSPRRLPKMTTKLNLAADGDRRATEAASWEYVPCQYPNSRKVLTDGSQRKWWARRDSPLPTLETICGRPPARGGPPVAAGRCHAARRDHHRTECACRRAN